MNGGDYIVGALVAAAVVSMTVLGGFPSAEPEIERFNGGGFGTGEGCHVTAFGVNTGDADRVLIEWDDPDHNGYPQSGGVVLQDTNFSQTGVPQWSNVTVRAVWYDTTPLESNTEVLGKYRVGPACKLQEVDA